MKFIIDLVTNPVFLSAAGSWFIAQLSKVIIDAVKNGFSVERLTGGGGMPSAHSATVTGLVVSSGIIYGGGSFEFVIALFFGIIVVYDAVGVRRETGIEAGILNRLRKRDIEEGRQPLQDENLQEKMGHTVPEIIAGIIVGIIIAIIVCYIISCFK